MVLDGFGWGPGDDLFKGKFMVFFFPCFATGFMLQYLSLCIILLYTRGFFLMLNVQFVWHVCWNVPKALHMGLYKYGRIPVLIQNKNPYYLAGQCRFQHPSGFGTNPLLVFVLACTKLTQKNESHRINLWDLFTNLFHQIKNSTIRIYLNIIYHPSIPPPQKWMNLFGQGTALASCHHSLQLGCLRYQSFGSVDIKTMPFCKADLITYSHYTATSCLSIFNQ